MVPPGRIGLTGVALLVLVAPGGCRNLFPYSSGGDLRGEQREAGGHRDAGGPAVDASRVDGSGDQRPSADLPSCGALLYSKGLPGEGAGCCKEGCRPSSTLAGRPGETYDCNYCCSAVVGQWACSDQPDCGTLLAALRLPDDKRGCCGWAGCLDPSGEARVEPEGTKDCETCCASTPGQSQVCR